MYRSSFHFFSWMQSNALQAVDEDEHEHEHDGMRGDAGLHSLDDDVPLRQRYGSVPGSPK